MVKPGYKKTEIGFLPEAWDTITFEESFSILSNNTLSRAELNLNGGELRNIHYGDILVKYPAVLDCDKEKLPYISAEYMAKANKGFLRDGDLVIADTAEDTTVGRSTEVIAIGDKKIVSGLHTIPCRPKNAEMFAPKWLGYFINHGIFHNQLIPYITGIKVSSISKSAISGTVIAVPKKEEQEKIVETLSDIDALIVNLKKLIAKKKAIKQGAMQELLTGKRRLPGYTAGWIDAKLSELCKVVMGQSPDSRYYSTSEGIPLVQGNADIENQQTVVRFFTTFVTKEASKGDIIFTVRAPVGNVAHAVFDCCIGRGVCALKDGTDFLFHLLMFYKKAWSTVSSGSTFDSINSDTLSSTVFHIPSDSEEQTAIARILSDMDHEIAVLEDKLAKSINIKTGMMSELLTGRIRLIDKGDV